MADAAAARPRLMGVVNATPDSFSDGGRFLDPAAAIDHAFALAEEGADILDIGGESTRPGAEPVGDAEEVDRVLPVIEGLAGKTGAVLSIDTRKPDVARAAIAAGATLWNDVSALMYAEDSIETAVELGCDVVLMHAQGDPRTMQDNPTYTDVVAEAMAFLSGRLELAEAAGLPKERLIVDPGIGFGKRVKHNIALIAHLDRFRALGAPILFGASRKRFIAALDREGPADQRLGGSIAAALAAAAAGAEILRVHDVAATRQALAVAGAVETARNLR